MSKIRIFLWYVIYKIYHLYLKKKKKEHALTEIPSLETRHLKYQK